MNPLYIFVATRASLRCEYCHAPEEIFNFAFEVEHIVPQALGKDNSPSNLALACRSCNLYKSATVEGRDKVTQSQSRLFHPRIDRWEEHFQVNTETAELTGLTPIGRVTITCLSMNRPRQVAARRCWIEFGLFT